MLSDSKRNRVQSILRRLAHNQEISFEERVYAQKLADTDQTVSSWLKRARRMQQQQPEKTDSIDNLLMELDLCSPDPDNIYHPETEDLGDWFKGSPSWITRS